MSRASNGPRPRLCLNMIVRNEAAIIERCLASVRPFIDYWVILDTGSHDDTTVRIENFFATAGIAGELHHQPFRDFSASRNQALELCRKSAGRFDYILLIDADMELVVPRAEALTRLEHSAYSVEQRNALVYHNVRLVHRALDARYRGVTHEYLDIGLPAPALAGVHMLDHACGANRAGKFERDIQLLEQGLRDEPDNLRYRFYLAQSLRDAGRPAEALPHYLARSEGGGWEEEAWYAACQAAACLLDTGDQAGFVEAAEAAWRRRPWRAEPLARLARHYRETGQYDLACHWALQGRGIAFPTDDLLFVEQAVYQWLFSQELAIAGYYAQDPQQRALGRRCCEQLSLDRMVPESVRAQARCNLAWYAHRAGEWLGMRNSRELQPEAPAGWACTNPSVCRDENAAAVVVRQVNYRIVAGRYEIHDQGQVIRTRNVLLPLAPDESPGAAIRLTDETPHENLPRFDFPVRGLEDARLFRWRGRWYATATVREHHPQGRCEIALLELDDDGRIAGQTLLRGAWSDGHQKNWMPLVRDDELLLVYSLSPTRIVRFDPQQRLARPFAHSETSIIAEQLRGGSQLVRVTHPGLDGWLGVCHEVCPWHDGGRRYLHRFFALDSGLQLAALSECFSFTGAPIEFCAGLALAADRQTLLVSFGVNDARAMLAEMALERVLDVLRPLAADA